MEVCDGTPQYVEEYLENFLVTGSGRYCPWESHIIWVGADTTLPNVVITAPIAYATVRGAVPVTFTRSDNVMVARTEISVDGVKLANVYDPPNKNTNLVTYNWDSTKVPNGNHIITVKVLDAAGNRQTKTVAVVVFN
jgi:hypothetical protein